jgi:hypothetical protein
MAASAGPDIIEDGIVFYYDTGNTVKSYIGEPTTNLALDTLQQGGWPGTNTLISSGTKTFDLTTSTVEWGGDASWTMFYYDVTAYTGQHICLSATYEYSSSPGGGNLAFVMIGQTTGSQTYLGYSSPLDYNSVSPTPGQQISWNGVIGDGGKIGILTWMNNGNSTTLTSRFSKIQLEVKTHPTQFVNGTRSVTQGLLDMARNSTVNLTDVSFNSTAQITFDGTNDSLVVGNNATLKNNNTSIEFVIKYLNTPNGDIIQFGVGSGTYAQYYYRAYSGYSFWNWYPVGTGYGEIAIPNAALPLNQYHHIVMTGDDQGYVQFYINGIMQIGATRTSNTQPSNWTPADLTVGGFSWDGYSSSDIPLVKIYNRVLSASEVLTNYNAFKTRFGI